MNDVAEITPLHARNDGAEIHSMPENMAQYSVLSRNGTASTPGMIAQIFIPRHKL
jgi:hypothetical protein